MKPSLLKAQKIARSRTVRLIKFICAGAFWALLLYSAVTHA